MSEDILIKWFENLVSFIQKNPFYTTAVIIIAIVSIYGIIKLIDKLRTG